MTYIEVRKTLEYFAYLGFIEPPEDTQLSAINGKFNNIHRIFPENINTL